MLEDSGLSNGVPDVRAGYPEMPLRLQRVIQQDAVADDVGLSLGVVATAAKEDPSTPITGLRRDAEDENDSNKECYHSLNCTRQAVSNMSTSVDEFELAYSRKSISNLPARRCHRGSANPLRLDWSWPMQTSGRRRRDSCEVRSRPFYTMLTSSTGRLEDRYQL